MKNPARSAGISNPTTDMITASSQIQRNLLAVDEASRRTALHLSFAQAVEEYKGEYKQRYERFLQIRAHENRPVIRRRDMRKTTLGEKEEIAFASLRYLIAS